MTIEQNSTNESSSISKANEVLAAISGLGSIAQLIESAIAEIDLSKEQALLAIAGRLLGLGLVPPSQEDDGNPLQLGLPSNPQLFPFMANGQGLGFDVETGLPIEGPMEAPVDDLELPNPATSLESLKSQIKSELSGEMKTTMNGLHDELKGLVGEAVSKAVSQIKVPECNCGDGFVTNEKNPNQLSGGGGGNVK